jgi:hypothetical protein
MTQAVPRSRFQVPGSSSTFEFKVRGSRFEVPESIAADSRFGEAVRLRGTVNPELRALNTVNLERGTGNGEPKLRTRTRNVEPGTWNGDVR